VYGFISPNNNNNNNNNYYFRTIQLFLKKKYDKFYQIHVIDECAIHGSILATLNDCYLRAKGSGEDLRLPGNMMQHVFQYHFSDNVSS
jgi:hypothetical protein